MRRILMTTFCQLPDSRMLTAVHYSNEEDLADDITERLDMPGFSGMLISFDTKEQILERLKEHGQVEIIDCGKEMAN